MIQFLLPGFLVGLAGLSIPLIIHLWNTRDKKIIKVGSIRWFTASDAIKVNRIRISEIPLLFLRMLVIGLLVILMADYRSTLMPVGSPANWVLIDPGVSNPEKLMEELEVAEGWEIRWLYPDFPMIDEEVVVEIKNNYWKLLAELDVSADKPDSIKIYSQLNIANFQGPRPSLNMNVEWISLPNMEIENHPILAYKVRELTSVYGAKYDGKKLVPYQVPTQNFDELELQTVLLKPIHYQIHGNPASWEYQNIEAVIKAVDEMGLGRMTMDSLQNPDVVFNMITTDATGSMMTFNYKPGLVQNKLLLEDHERANTYIISQKLSIENIMKYGLVYDLYQLLTPDFNKELIKNSNLQMSPKQARTRSAEQLIHVKADRLAKLTFPLWLVLIGMIISERLLAFYRKQ